MARAKPATAETSRGFSLLRVLGIEIRIDYSWFIIFGLVLWTLAAGYYPQAFPGQSASVYWGMSFLSALMLFASVLIHELSHSIVARREGLPVRRITLFIFGGMAHISQEPTSAGAEFRIAAIGPVTSFVLAGLFWGLAQATRSVSDILGESFWYLALANFILAVFNLVPGFPLDGGRVLRAWLWHRWKDFRRATGAAARAGKTTGTVLILLGILEVFLGALVGGLWMVFIGMFLRQAAEGSYQSAALQEMLRDVHVSDLMQAEPVAVADDATLQQLVEDFFYRYRFGTFPVTHAGRLAGLIQINQVKDVPRERWADTRVADVMLPLEAIAVAAPDDDVSDAFRAMSRTGLRKIPVVRDGRLVGMLTAQDILDLFRLKSDLLD